MITIHLDIETYSSIDLAKSGVYAYSESNDFEILLFGYSVDNKESVVVDLANGEQIPHEIIDALKSDSVIKYAFNANFERTCLSKYLGVKLNPKSWHCTMIWSAYMGLPLSLDGVGVVLGLEKQKLVEGKELIRYFCMPCKPTKANNQRTRNLMSDALDKWLAFKEYNKRDVEVEILIHHKLEKFSVPSFVWDEYHLDQEINDCGVKLDMDFVKKAIKLDDISRTELLEQMKKLTNLENPNSVLQMKKWLNAQGLETDSLGKKAVSELMDGASKELIQVLELRKQTAKSSVKKYQAMENCVCSDGRARGMFQFYGANRTGRFSGRLVQLQNLPRNEMPDLEQARNLVKDGNFIALNVLYDSVPNVLSELIRTAFIPKENHKFIVADFSAIEARVLSWLAKETWRNEVFMTHGKIYEASASQMFRIPIEEITKGSPLRQKGKQAELGCGYGGSVGALKAMGALDMGVTEEELQPLVTAWRQANPNIVNLWKEVDKAVTKAVKERTKTETHNIIFICRSGMLFIKLPSGRNLAYVKPQIGVNQFASDCVTYEGIGSTKKWERTESYGAKFVENIVQAIARDILVEAMMKLKKLGYEIVMHVHDEVVIEAPKDVEVNTICDVLGETPSWAKGLLLRADGYETNFYKKD